MNLGNIKTSGDNNGYKLVIAEQNGNKTDVCTCFNTVIKNEQGKFKNITSEDMAKRIVKALKLLYKIENLPKTITKKELLEQLNINNL